MIYAVRRCPVNRMTLCVTSEPELEKCVKMKVSITKLIYSMLFFYNIKLKLLLFVLDCNESSTSKARIIMLQRPKSHSLYAGHSKRVNIEN